MHITRLKTWFGGQIFHTQGPREHVKANHFTFWLWLFGELGESFKLIHIWIKSKCQSNKFSVKVLKRWWYNDNLERSTTQKLKGKRQMFNIMNGIKIVIIVSECLNLIRMWSNVNWIWSYMTMICIAQCQPSFCGLNIEIGSKETNVMNIGDYCFRVSEANQDVKQCESDNDMHCSMPAWLLRVEYWNWRIVQCSSKQCPLCAVQSVSMKGKVMDYWA